MVKLMNNFVSLIGSNFGVVFAASFSACVLVALAITLFFMWWVDVKKRTVKSFFVSIKNGLFKACETVGDFFSNSKVKTVYSNKALNYSGTEFLPIPSKEPNSKYSYEFLGWEKFGKDSEDNVLVRAIFLQRTNKCYINVYNDDKETLLKSFEIDFGSGIYLGDVVPEKEDSKEFSFVFAGWDKDITAFYKNENVYAVYKAIPKKFTYKFLDSNGELVSTGTAIYGTPIIPPAPPVKQNQNGKVFRFVGWKNFRENLTLTKDCSFVAQYIEGQEASVLGTTIVNLSGEQYQLGSVQTNVATKENSKKTNNLNQNIYKAPIFDFADEKQIKKSKEKSLALKLKSINSKTPKISHDYSVISEGERELQEPMFHKIDISKLTAEETKNPATPTITTRIMKVEKAKQEHQKPKRAEIKLSPTSEDADMRDLTPLVAKKTKNIVNAETKKEEEKSPLEGLLVSHKKIVKTQSKK